MKLKLLTPFLFLFFIKANAQVKINEIMDFNMTTVKDDDNDYSDWVELYNAGSSSVNLSNYSLSDNADSLQKWKFPSVSISAGGYLTVWCSGKNRTGTNLHTNFKLNVEGEMLFLSNAAGTVIDNINFGYIPADKSYGRLNNGTANIVYLSKPTYKASNNSAAAVAGALTTYPDFNIKGGMYTSSQNIILSHPDPTYVIRYTLDGSDPTDNSPIYSAPINVHSRVGEPNVYSLIRTGYPNHSYLPDWYPPVGEVYKCNIIRARVFKTGYFPGPVKTHTYFVDPNIFTRYGKLPLVSVVSDPKNLFNDTTGIYVPGLEYLATQNHGNYHLEWTKPANIEIFRPDGHREINGIFKFDIGGESSKASPQKSLNCNASNDYGPNEFDYPLFENTPGSAKYIQKFNKIKIRSWGTDRRKGLLHDGFSNSFMMKTNLDFTAYQPCVMFIDGEYWGLQEIRERNKSGDYYESHYYIDKDNPGFDILKGGANDILEGDAVHWDAMISYINSHPMNNAANYNYVKTQMDVDNYMLYNMFSIYLARGDWPDQNEAKWRPKIPGAKWKWIQWDMDNGVANNLAYSFDMFNQVMVGTGTYGPSPLFQKLIQNQEFKYNLINYFADYMNTYFLPKLANDRLDSMVNQLMPYMQEMKDRWQLNYTWQDRLDSMEDWLNKRPKYVKQHILSDFSISDTVQLTLTVSDSLKGNIKINSLLLDRSLPRINALVYPWKGTYYKNVPVPLTAIPKPGYKFVKWLPSNITTATMTLTPTTTTTITAVFDIDPNYQAGVLPVINEAMSGNALVIADNYGDFDDWIEIYNPGSDTLNLAGYYLTSNLVLPTRFPIRSGNDSTKVPPHGFKMIWMDDDTEQGILHANFKLNAGGNYVALIDKDGTTIVDSITVNNVQSNQSYGRATDANPQWIIFPVSTPGYSNNQCIAPTTATATASNNIVCIGNNLNLHSSSNGTVTSWHWTGPNGYTSLLQNPSISITQANQAGLYSVIASNSCGSASNSISVTVNTLPLNVTANSNGNNICTGQTINFTGGGTGINSWAWTGPNGYSSSMQNPSLLITQANQAGTYVMTATNTCGSASASTNLVVNTTPSGASASANSSSLCPGQTLNLTSSATGNITTWAWSGPAGFTASSQNTSRSITMPTQAGAYVVTATNSCGSTSASVNIAVGSSLSNLSASGSPNSVCIGNSVNLNSSVTGTALTWSWTGPNGFTSSSQNPTLNITQTTQAGNYVVTATNGCGSISASTSITVSSSISNTQATVSSNSICTGGTLNLHATATGSVSSWNWTGPNGFASTSQNPNLNITSAAQAGAYTVTATSGCGNQSASVSVSVNAPPANVQATANANSICIGSTLNLSGNGTVVTTWSWTGPASFISSSQNPVINITGTTQSGNYIVTGTNSCGTTTSSISINVGAIPSNVIAVANATTLCTGQTLNLTSTGTGATGWSWTGPGGYSTTTQNPSISLTQTTQAGTYIVTATNSCGNKTASTNVAVNTVPVNVLATATSNSVCTGGTLSLHGAASGTVTT